MSRAGVLIAAVCAAGVSLATMVAARCAPKLVLINESPSLPKGLYVRARAGIARGAIVALDQPPPARAYLAKLGMPADVALIKRVAAQHGDRVCAVGERMVLPDRILRVQRRDRLGVTLPRWRGCRRLGPDELFVIGSTANSFDSRYFGPVSRVSVEGVFREAIPW